MFPSHTKLKIRFKCKDIFPETIVHKCNHCNHSLPSSAYHTLHVEHSLLLLLDFWWPHSNIISFVVSLSVKGFLVYCRLEKFYTVISSVIDLPNKFVDWKCFGDGLCLMDVFRLNYFIRFRQVHSNNRWHKFHGSIRKFFGCMDHNLAWLYFSENEVFDGSAPTSSIGTLPWCPSLQNQHNDLFKNIFSANSWKINLDQNWVPMPSLHKTTLANDLPHFVSTIPITFFRQLIDVILVWSEVSVTTTTFLFFISLVTPSK